MRDTGIAALTAEENSKEETKRAEGCKTTTKEERKEEKGKKRSSNVEFGLERPDE
jgi:hypothetical protein